MSDGPTTHRFTSRASERTEDADTERDDIRIAEYGSATIGFDRLTPADLRRLADLESHKALRLTESRQGWCITADAVVGVLVFDHVRLTIEPKLAISGNQLVTWLRYVLATQVPHQPSHRRWQTSRNGITDLIASELVAACQELLRGGLRRDYVLRESIDSVLRGRLDLKPQIARRFGQIDRFHIRTFERETAVWENELCGAALRTAARIATDDTLARDAATLAAQFPQPQRVEPILRKLDRSRYNRLNSRYRTAHTWSELILRGDGISDLLVDTGHDADSLLLRMSTLWESVVRTMAQDAAGAIGGTVTDTRNGQSIATTGDLTRRSPFRPDVLIRFGGATPTYLPIDAKYKSYDTASISSGDVHQLLTYVAGYSATESASAAIVYPSDRGASQRRLTVKGAQGRLGTINVLGLDVSQPPTESAEPLRTYLRATAPTPAG